ncbi:Gfo/Idh/MocA family protein [Pontiella sulfatireligans]|uniref:Glucose-6-phosphate 3-dehydrogenase n=1 Tax=Pontiella sulfatireligans TaxID=2750658 RepID=A0A6C2UIW4_9BACT|nr:Gfo/Idh/MocA family oxidoreductase [Pontiella sulfatireligans]VGO20162.1 Glucose-6-phosphate 3-dehydrogenase [Pontiella sulfatireligans]
MDRKLRMGMIGGGPGAFIGDVHRKAARLDGQIEIVAGAFDIDPKKSKQMGQELAINPKRVYGDVATMIEKELALPEDERIDFVSVCTPNHTHFPIAKAFLEAGFNVMCEKPMTLSVAEAEELKVAVQKSKKVFGLMHNYTAYPMVKLAKDMIKQGDIGKIRKVIVQYPQGWLARAAEKEGSQQAEWRTDPKKSGAAGCMGDIGTHAANLAEYITGLAIKEIAADLTTFVKGRRLDDDGSCLLRLSKGAKGLLHASQVSIGQENNLAIWIHGEDGSIEWHQEHPNWLYVDSLGAPTQIWKRGNDYVGEKSEAAGRATRLPFGHPEAFLEAFANNYCNFADTIRAKNAKKKPTDVEKDFPGIKEGVLGMKFIEAVVESSKNNAAWTKL